MNNISMGVRPVTDTQVSNLSSKNGNKVSKDDQKKETTEVSVNKMSQRLSDSNNSVKGTVETKDTQELASQVSSGQGQLAAAQSGHITMEFVSSLLNKSPYEQGASAQ